MDGRSVGWMDGWMDGIAGSGDGGGSVGGGSYYVLQRTMQAMAAPLAPYYQRPTDRVSLAYCTASTARGPVAAG